MVATRRSDKKTAYKVGSKVEILTSEGISIGVLIKKLALGSILDHQQLSHSNNNPHIQTNRRNRGAPTHHHASAKKGESVDHWLVRLEGHDDPSPFSEHAFGKSVDDDYPMLLPSSVETSESESSSIHSTRITSEPANELDLVSTESASTTQQQTATVITPPTVTTAISDTKESKHSFTRRSLPTTAAKAERAQDAGRNTATTSATTSSLVQPSVQPKQRQTSVRRSLSPAEKAVEKEAAAAAVPVVVKAESSDSDKPKGEKKRKGSPVLSGNSSSPKVESSSIDPKKRRTSSEPAAALTPKPAAVKHEVASSTPVVVVESNSKEPKVVPVETQGRRGAFSSCTSTPPPKRVVARGKGKHAPAKTKPPARVSTRSSGQVLYTATDNVETLLKQRKNKKKDAAAGITTTTTMTNEHGETVIKIPMKTGILYLYRGKRRSAKFVPLK